MKIYPMIDKTDKYTIQKKELPDLPFKTLMCMKSGGGKSSLLGWLMCNDGEKGYKNDFDFENDVYIFSGSLKMSEGKPKGDYKLGKMIEFLDIPEENIFTDFDNDILNELYEMLVDDFNNSIEEGEKPTHKLIIIDDLGFKNQMNKTKQDNSSIDKIMCNGRKFLVSIVILNQRIIQFSPTCITQATSIIFNSPNNRDLEMYEKSFNYLKDKKSFNKMVRKYTEGSKHNFMCIDFSKEDIYRDKNFEPIKICKCGKNKNNCGFEKLD